MTRKEIADVRKGAFKRIVEHLDGAGLAELSDDKFHHVIQTLCLVHSAAMFEEHVREETAHDDDLLSAIEEASQHLRNHMENLNADCPSVAAALGVLYQALQKEAMG